MKNIEIKGIGFPNRGAELMLVAILQQFKKRGYEPNFVVEPMGDFRGRAKYPLQYKSRFSARGLNLGLPFSILPKVVRERYGIVNASEIDIVLDASGFAYGDRWGWKLLHHRFLAELKRYQGKPVFLLPQAFGPFEDKRLLNSFKKLVEVSSQIYCRDGVSAEYLKCVGVKGFKVAPDFTNLVDVSSCGVRPDLVGRVAVVPNFQMLRNHNDYIKVLSDSIDRLFENGEQPFLLIHEGPRDLSVAGEVRKLTKNKVEIVDPQDALAIKAIISRQKFIVSSRFHAVVSALSTGIPPIVMGWSHKYEELLKDYGVPELLCTVDSDVVYETYLSKCAMEAQRVLLQKGLKHHGDIQKASAVRMWDEVFAIIGEVLNE